MGKFSHISLFLVLMKNDFDALQKWPFLKSVKITIINQREAEESIVEVMTTTTNSTSWNKPTKDMNIAAGFPMFATQEKVYDKKAGFLKDDSLFIKCEVTSPQSQNKE